MSANIATDRLKLMYHATLRARQRYGVPMTADEWTWLSRRAGKKSRRRFFLGQRSQDERCYVALWFARRWMLAVYCQEAKAIVTFLPAHELMRWESFRNMAFQDKWYGETG